MKKLLTGLLASLPFMANAQFIPGQVLTAAELNNQFALYAPLAGATFTGGISATGITNTPISGSTGSFTNLTASGTVTLPAASVPLTRLATQAANTVVANATSGTVSPIAFVMPSCSTSASALTYTTNTGFTCNTAVNAAQLGGATFAAPGPIGSTTASTGAFTNLTTNGTITTTFPGGGGSSSNFINVSNGAGGPSIAFENTTFGADAKWWDILEGAGALYFRAVNDANNSSTFYMTVNRGSGFTVSNVSFGVPIAPTSTLGITGTTTNDNVQAGGVGEYASNSTLTTNLTSGTPANATSVSLTAGDWDVTGLCLFGSSATTTVATIECGVSTTSATFGAEGTYNILNANLTGNGAASSITPPVTRISLASTTTVYMVGSSTFGTSTMHVDGFIRARRIR